MPLAALLASCVGPGRPPLLTEPVRPAPARVLLAGAGIQPGSARDAPDPRRAVVGQAARYLGGAPLVAGGLEFEPDPVGFVRAAYWSAGIDLFDPDLAAALESAGSEWDGMELLYRSVAARGGLHHQQPRPGDLAFFDAEPGSRATVPRGVAVVERIEADGTLTVIGSFAAGPRRVVLNLRRPDQRATGSGKHTNDEIAAPAGAVSAAAVLRAFGDPF